MLIMIGANKSIGKFINLTTWFLYLHLPTHVLETGVKVREGFTIEGLQICALT